MSRPFQITCEAAIAALRAHAERNGGTIRYASGDVTTHLMLHEHELAVVEVLVQDATHWAFHDHLFGFDLAALSHGSALYFEVPRPLAYSEV